MRVRVCIPFVIVAAAVLGCEHGGPFHPINYGPSDPFNPPPLIRLALNPGRDYEPAFLPDGSIVFTAERGDRDDHDHCLAFLPSTGGAITRYACRTSASDDSLNVFEGAAALGGGGQIAFVRAASNRLPIIPVFPDVQALVVAPLGSPNAARVLQSIPYLAPSGRTHWGISHLRWLTPTQLVYVGEDVTYPRPCSSCAADTVRVGLELVTLDVAPAAPLLSVVPGTDSASSVAMGATHDTLYFTREGKSAIYRFAFPSGQIDTVYDFGAGRLVRDVAWAAGRFFVVVDGDPDIGGDLHIVDPIGGTDSIAPSPAGTVLWFRRPAPGADGLSVVAEGQLLSPTFTILSSRDIWLYDRH